mgnify:FL=1
MMFQTHENVVGNEEAEYREKVQAAIKKYTAVCFPCKLIEKSLKVLWFLFIYYPWKTL